MSHEYFKSWAQWREIQHSGQINSRKRPDLEWPRGKKRVLCPYHLHLASDLWLSVAVAHAVVR